MLIANSIGNDGSMEPQSSSIIQPPAHPTHAIPPHALGGAGWIIGIFGILGLGLLYLAYYLAEDTRRFVNHGVRVQGEVIELHFSRDSEGDGTYRPEVKYRTPEGVEYRFISSNGSNPASFSRGEQVEVLYLPENPQDGRIDAFFSLWGGVLICGVMGAIFALVGAGVWWGVYGQSNATAGWRRMAHASPPK